MSWIIADRAVTGPKVLVNLDNVSKLEGDEVGNLTVHFVGNAAIEHVSMDSCRHIDDLLAALPHLSPSEDFKLGESMLGGPAKLG